MKEPNKSEKWPLAVRWGTSRVISILYILNFHPNCGVLYFYTNNHKQVEITEKYIPVAVINQLNTVADICREKNLPYYP